jgi:hypothetical protein
MQTKQLKTKTRKCELKTSLIGVTVALGVCALYNS